MASVQSNSVIHCNYVEPAFRIWDRRSDDYFCTIAVLSTFDVLTTEAGYRHDIFSVANHTS